MVYREDNEQPEGTIDTWLPEGKKVTFTPVMGSGKKFAAKVGAQGKVSFELNDKNSFAFYQLRSENHENTINNNGIMIKSLRFVFLALFVALQFVAYGQPAERLVQVQVTPDHTNWLYKPGEK